MAAQRYLGTFTVLSLGLLLLGRYRWADMLKYAGALVEKL